MLITIDEKKCARCGRCAAVCPSAALSLQEGGAGTEVRDSEACIKCGHCLDVCATGAISHEAIPQAMVHRVRRELLPSPDSLMELIRSRRSNRTFTNEPIPAEMLARLKEAALYAPTAENSRNVEVLFITSQEHLLRIEREVMAFFMRIVRIMDSAPIRLILKPFLASLYARIPELLHMNQQLEAGRRPATVNATAIMLFTAPKGSSFGYQDCNLAYQNASLMAESLGISQVYLGFVQTAFALWGNRRTARLLGIGKDRKPFAIMALGLPAFRYVNYTER